MNLKSSNNPSTSIFNVTFGCLKYTTPADYCKRKVKDKKKGAVTTQQNQKVNSDKRVKINAKDENNNTFETPPPVKSQTDLIRNKAKYSSAKSGLYQDNSEYSSYVTAASNSNHKIREYSNEVINTKHFDQHKLADSKQTLYLNRRESYKVKPKERQPDMTPAVNIPNSRFNFNNSGAEFKLEDVFLRNELKQKLKLQNSILIKNRNADREDTQANSSSYMR